MHGKGKGSDPHIKPERQKPTSSSSDVRAHVQKPRIGQGRTGVRRKMRIALLPQQRQIPIPEPKPKVATQLQVTSEHKTPVQTSSRQPICPRIEARQVLNDPVPLLRLPPRLPDLTENRKGLTDLDMDINTNFE